MVTNTRVIALDLEGTLISNAISQFPRPGLRDFLEFCYAAFPRVVLFTTVPEGVALRIVQLLVTEGEAPPDLLERFDYVSWHGPQKDLSFIAGASPEEVLLLDDQERVVPAHQHHRWVQIREFDHPYPADDRELVEARADIERRLRANDRVEAGNPVKGS